MVADASDCLSRGVPPRTLSDSKTANTASNALAALADNRTANTALNALAALADNRTANTASKALGALADNRTANTASKALGALAVARRHISASPHCPAEIGVAETTTRTRARLALSVRQGW